MKRASSLLLIAPLCFLGACGRSEEKQADLPPPTVSVAPVQFRTLAGGFTASGRLIPREEIAVAPELSNFRIARVFVEEDAQVRAGQVLATLDNTLLRSQIAQARASLAQQQVQAERARSEARRVVGLENSGVLPVESIEQRRFADRNAAAAAQVAQAQLQDLLTREARLTIRAPVSGRVLQRSARPGDASSSGQVMFTIARDNLIELDAEVPEASMANVSIGDPAEVTLADGTRLAGRVRLRGARVDDRTGLSRARISLPVRSDLRAGGFAQAHFVKASASATVVPEAAVHYDADGAYMLLLDKGDRVHRASVRTGRRAGGMVEIVAGARVGQRAVLSGGAFVLEGDKVRIGGAMPRTASRPGQTQEGEGR